MEKITYELRILFDKKNPCRCQYVYETNEIYKKPYSVNDHSNIIDNLGNSCQLYLVSNEKLQLGDFYIITDAKSVDYGSYRCSDPRILQIANDSPNMQRKIIMSTQRKWPFTEDSVYEISDDFLYVLMDIYNKQTSKTIQEFLEEYNLIEYLVSADFKELQKLIQNHRIK